MAYTALPDRRIPYDNDGTIIYQGTIFDGVQELVTGATAIEWQDADYTAAGRVIAGYTDAATWFFFPEQREVTAFHFVWSEPANVIQGSNDSGNGTDGTWETATLGGGIPSAYSAFAWRESIKPISFTGAKKTIRSKCYIYNSNDKRVICGHLYGEKAAGQTPDDLIFIDHDTTPGTEYQAPEDFGDQALATTVVRQFRVKNASATKTANTINIQCNDADFGISTDNSTWVVTINLASLAAGAESPTYYVRCVTPAIGSLLGPRFARIIATVASYT